MSFFTPKQTKKNIIIFNHPLQYKKRTLPSSFQRAVLTVEAAIVTPIMLFAFVLMISPMLIINTQLLIHEKLTNCALKLNCYDFIAGRIKNTSELSASAANCMTFAYAHKEVFDDELVPALKNSIINTGSANMFLSSLNTKNHIFDLIFTYDVPLPFTNIILKGIQRCRIRGHAGLSLLETDGKTDTTVYITRKGHVYHGSIYCQYLINYISTDFSGYDEVISYNNKRYSRCLRCTYTSSDSPGTPPRFIYITASGERYHYTLDCPTLQSGVYAVRLGDCPDTMRPCSRCRLTEAKP